MPTEAIFNGEEMKVEIAYGPDDRITKTTNLQQPSQAVKDAGATAKSDDSRMEVAEQNQSTSGE